MNSFVGEDKDFSCFTIAFSRIFERKGRLCIGLYLARTSGSRVGCFLEEV